MAADQPKLKEGTGFGVLADPDETWKKIRDGVKDSLVPSGHTSATTLRLIDMVRMLVTRLHHFPVVPRFSVGLRASMDRTSYQSVANVEKQRAASSSRVRLRPGLAFPPQSKHQVPMFGKINRCLATSWHAASYTYAPSVPTYVPRVRPICVLVSVPLCNTEVSVYLHSQG